MFFPARGVDALAYCDVEYDEDLLTRSLRHARKMKHVSYRLSLKLNFISSFRSLIRCYTSRLRGMRVDLPPTSQTAQTTKG